MPNMNLSAFDMNLLKVLDALLIEGSTTRAATRVGLSQPAVSAALGRLRSALDDPLFVRDGGALRPTPFALSLRAPLRAYLNGLAQMLSGLEEFDPARYEGTFCISGSDYFSVMLLPRLMKHLGRHAPHLKISFVDVVHPSNLADMGRLDVDLSLPCVAGLPDNLDGEPMFWSDWQIVARHDHPRLKHHAIDSGQPIPLELYCDLEHIVFSADGRHASYEDKVLADLGRSRSVALAVGSFRDLYETVAGSDLIAIIPKSLAQTVAARFDLTMHPLPFQMEPALLWTAWNRWHTDDPAHRWLREQVAAILTALNDVDRPLPQTSMPLVRTAAE